MRDYECALTSLADLAFIREDPENGIDNTNERGEGKNIILCDVFPWFNYMYVIMIIFTRIYAIN